MRKIVMKYIGILLLCLFNATVWAQNLKEDMVKMQQAYDNMERLSATIITKEFEGNKMLSKEQYSLKMAGSSYLYQLTNTIVLRNERYMVSVNQNDKQVICTSQKKEKGATEIMKKVKPNVSAMLDKYDKVTFLGESNGLKTYRMENKEMEGVQITKIEFTFDVNTFVVDNMRYYYNEADYGKNWIEIRFKEFDINPSFQMRLFDESKYVQTIGKELKLSDAYKDYRLIITR